MADQDKSMNGENSGAEGLRRDLLKDETMPGLHQFVAEQYEKQKEEHGNINDEEERINNFFARAVSESRRMSGEVEKSHRQQQKLYAELGKEMFMEWREEHCAQVLPGQGNQRIIEAVENMDLQ